MKLFVITSIYATSTQKDSATPVVHYFTREWAKMGHDVTVFHFAAKFPKFYYSFSKHLQFRLNSLLNIPVPIDPPKEADFQAEGVTIVRRTLRKIFPHSRYSKKQIRRANKIIDEYCRKNGAPDYFIGHWHNPQLEILNALKQRFHRPVALVLHESKFNYEAIYGQEAVPLLKGIDVMGFRSGIGMKNFENKYFVPTKSFIAYSGVSKDFLDAGSDFHKNFSCPVTNYIFVGNLIERKYPTAVLSALASSYPGENYSITYIGDGFEKENILAEHRRIKDAGTVHFTGRIPRNKIIDYLKGSDIFVMVSRDEIFGLVYLEAMALGLIPIGSKNEGIDGIIVNGKNGFLCEAGNVDELAQIIESIKRMTKAQLLAMSEEAKNTAAAFSDEIVAMNYLSKIQQ